jgi:hypothetical protein
MKQAPTNHEIFMLLILLLWISLVLGVAVGSYWLWAIVQSTRLLRLRVPRRRDDLPRATAYRTQKRYDPGPMPQLFWQDPAPRTGLPTERRMLDGGAPTRVHETDL